MVVFSVHPSGIGAGNGKISKGANTAFRSQDNKLGLVMVLLVLILVPAVLVINAAGAGAIALSRPCDLLQNEDCHRCSLGRNGELFLSALQPGVRPGAVQLLQCCVPFTD
jgi:hypothetical protein